ncbi:hypothetical protein AYO44_01780 [Planctomycetaceae bacterium SCGC AG-212-F19]|nr:hypothetical protein AYO44_01780 [Planctomycetaceae bacterium SCGC AG-212-F19]
MSRAFPFRNRHLAALTLVLLAGCAGRGSDHATGVAGKVSYRGKPVGTGTIVFVPDAARGTNGDPLCSAIGADGGYKLPTDKSAVPSGWYRITVAAVAVPPAVPGQAFAVPYSLLPDRYRDPELSGLLCEVKPGRDNAINFNLE